MPRQLFVAPEEDTLPLFDDGQYWIKVKRSLNAGEEKHLQVGALRRIVANRTDGEIRDDSTAFDVDLEAAAFLKVSLYLLDWNLPGTDGKTVSIGTPKAKRDALRSLAPDVYREIERVVDAHQAQQAQEKKVPNGSLVSETS